MRNYLVGLLLILVIVSCTTKKENEKPVVHNAYVSKPVGVIKDGVYSISDFDSRVQKWEAVLREGFGLTDSISFSKFEIVKTSTYGEVSEECYLLLTRTSDGLSVIAVILKLEGDAFYFDINPKNERKTSQVIMCKGNEAGSACMPKVLLHNKEKKLVCPGTCSKIISEILL